MSLTVDKIQSLAEEIHNNAVDKGFWDGVRNLNEARMLIITELAEAVEAHREGRVANIDQFKKDVIEIDKDVVYPDWNALFANYIKDSISDEFADAYIRILDLLYYETKGKVAEELNKEKARQGWNTTSNFAESIYYICKTIMGDLFSGKHLIEYYCKELDIDLEWHVEQKMKYNSLRERMHGKKY